MTISELIAAIGAGGVVLTALVAAVFALPQYRLKLKEEQRLAESARAEIDVKLIKAFAELVDLAAGRRQHIVSEKAIEEIFKLGVISKEDFDSDFSKRQEGSKKLSEYPVIVISVGALAQEVAFAAIMVLGKEYEVLASPAKVAIERIRHNNPAMAAGHAERMDRLTERA
jgi:hypothetical protein